MERNRWRIFPEKNKNLPRKKRTHVFPPKNSALEVFFLACGNNWPFLFLKWGTWVHPSGGSTSIRCAAKKVSPLLCHFEIAKVGSEIGWLKPVGGLETANGNGWRYQAGWNSEGWRLYVYIYIYVLYMDSWIVMSGWSSRLCCYFSGDNGYCVIQDQGTTWGTIEYSSSLEFLLGALYSCNIPVKF